MTRLPKLKIKGLGWDTEKDYDFEQAKHFPFDQGLIIAVEDKVIDSYEDIVQLANQDPNKDKELLEVMFLEIIVGG